MKKSSKEIYFNNAINLNRPYITISQVLSLIKEPFDSEGVAQKTYDKHHDNPESEYYGMSVEQIIEEWNKRGAVSCQYGSLLDDYIGYTLNENQTELELFKLDNDIDADERLKGITSSFDNFLKMMEKVSDVEYVDRERTLYLDMGDYYVKGRFDALFYSPKTDTYIIVDWKSTANISCIPDRWTKKLLGAAKNIDALDINTYTLQTQFYKMALLKHYLPTGTPSDKVSCRIVNLNGVMNNDGRNFKIFKENLMYDEEQLSKIFDFAFKKNKLINNK